MKTYSTNPNDHDHELDNDLVWDLIDQASPGAASPTFLQDTLRRARLEGQTTTSWWQKARSPLTLLGSTIAACASIIFVVSLHSDSSPESTVVASAFPVAPAEELTALEDVLATELILAASEDPELLSSDELLGLLF